MSTRLIRQRLATGVALTGLALGVLLGVAASDPPSAQAAPRRPVDTGVRCAVQTGPGNWEFFLPGETIVVVDANGNWHYYLCGSNGDWVPSGPVAITTNTRRVAQLPSNPLVLTQ